MKKLIILILCFLVCGCGYKYNELSYSDLELKLSNKENFILLIGSDTCHACADFEKTMKKVMKDTNVKINYININGLTEEENAKLYGKFVFQYTPTTVFVENGEETSTYDRIIGSADYDVVIKKLKEKGYINE